MLNNIYYGLELAVIVMNVVCLVFITVIKVKKKFHTVPQIEFQIVMTSTLCLILLFRIILGVILEKSISLTIAHIINLVFWILCTTLYFLDLSLKVAEDTDAPTLTLIQLLRMKMREWNEILTRRRIWNNTKWKW